MFQRLINLFIKIFIFIQFNLKSFIQIKIDILKFVIIIILFQLILASDNFK